jgi:ABC-type Mn2+/Zn2+ transport system permease subunit
MRNALMAGVLVSIACGIVGTMDNAVINRIVFITDAGIGCAIPHRVCHELPRPEVVL